MKLSRRKLLAGGGIAAVGGAAVLALPPVRRSICGSPEDLYREASIAAVGRACVACDPALTRDEVARRWAALGAPDEAALAARSAADFGSGRVRQVDGWLLAESEVLGYAAAYHGLGRG